MLVEIFSICDAATDYGGRLNVLGAFEGIAASSAPIVRDRCSLAVRLRFEAAETGRHAVEVRIVDKGGRVIGPTMSASLMTKLLAGRESGAQNLVLNINGLTFPAFGTYRIELRVDGEERSYLPLLVAQAQKRSRTRGAMDN